MRGERKRERKEGRDNEEGEGGEQERGGDGEIQQGMRVHVKLGSSYPAHGPWRCSRDLPEGLAHLCKRHQFIE